MAIMFQQDGHSASECFFCSSSNCEAYMKLTTNTPWGRDGLIFWQTQFSAKWFQIFMRRDRYRPTLKLIFCIDLFKLFAWHFKFIHAHCLNTLMIHFNVTITLSFSNKFQNSACSLRRYGRPTKKRTRAIVCTWKRFKETHSSFALE